MYRLLSKKRWDEMINLWITKHSEDPYWQMTGMKVAMFVSSFKNVKWSAPIKSAGIPCTTGAKYKVIDRLRDTLHQNHEMPYRILIVGNAKCSPPMDLKDYDMVVGFNDLNNKWVIPWMTHHWMRSNTTKANSWGGKSIAPIRKGIDITLCDTIDHDAEVRKYLDSGCIVNKFRVRALCPEYPGNKCSSTGFAAVHSYIRWNFHVYATGFTWEGLDCHDWKFERETMKKYIEQGKLTLL